MIRGWTHCSWLFRFRGVAQLRNTWAGSIGFTKANANLVIELDGAQHLADAEAYRRDRRKDALLQQNGLFVLRFLAEDMGKHLDRVLDTILATLAHRQNRRR